MGFVLCSSAAAQQAFEVASVRPSTTGINGVRGGCHGVDSKYDPGKLAPPPLGRCVITDGRLSHMIQIAWGLSAIGEIRNAPDWAIAGDDRFTIQAKVDNPQTATERQLMEMLQALIVERFDLKFHREDKAVPGFALVVGKKGPKLAETASETSELLTAGKLRPHGADSISAKRYSVADLAHLLTRMEPGPVKDETGLAGLYDFNLSWDETNGPALTTALSEQLGLRLESRKVPVSYFVIESARKPAGN
jgi:uncharacterized protein (TIGR03435 family)